MQNWFVESVKGIGNGRPARVGDEQHILADKVLSSAAARDDRQPLHSGEWGLATLEVRLPISESSGLGMMSLLCIKPKSALTPRVAPHFQSI
jgi:hypothetical protein